MAYFSIDTKTTEGKKLWESIRKNKAVKELRTPNEVTKQALIDAKAGKVKEIINTSDWLKKLLS